MLTTWSSTFSRQGDGVVLPGKDGQIASSGNIGKREGYATSLPSWIRGFLGLSLTLGIVANIPGGMEA